jgi:hypothetical protein
LYEVHIWKFAWSASIVFNLLENRLPLLLWYNGKDREVGFNHDTEFELKHNQIENKVKSSSFGLPLNKIFGLAIPA